MLKSIIASLRLAWANLVLLVRAAPEPTFDKPPIKYIDGTGTGWREAPDYNEAWAPDHGQHEVWKREMRVWIWRVSRGMTAPCAVNLFDVGLSSVPDFRHYGYADLMGLDLASVSRRLGFVYLAQAAYPDMDTATLRIAYEMHEANVHAEAERRAKLNAEHAATWNPDKGPHVTDTFDQTVEVLTAGPFDGAPLPPGKVRQPLTPIEGFASTFGAGGYLRRVK